MNKSRPKSVALQKYLLLLHFFPTEKNKGKTYDIETFFFPVFYFQIPPTQKSRRFFFTFLSGKRIFP